MSVSLFDLSVPTFLQTVRTIGGCLDKANAHCSEIGADRDDFVTGRLVESMAPFHFQIECVAHRSSWALETVKSAVFSAPALIGEMPFSDLRAMVAETEATLRALGPDQVNEWSGKDLDLQIGPRKLSFTSETYLLSFAFPNFFFHAVTVYDILRTRGVLSMAA